MKSIKVLTVIIVGFLFYPNALYAANLQDGIFGLKWGSNLSKLSGFSELWSKSNVGFYIKPNEALTINDFIVNEIIYGLYTNQFFAVYIKIDTVEVFGEFRRYMKSKYGIPKKTMSLKDELTVYRWKYKDIKIKLKLNQKNNQMKLAFYYTPLSDKVNEALHEKFQRKSFKFFPIDKNKTSVMFPLLHF